MNSYYDEYLNIFVDTFCACAVFVMAHPLISCIVYDTQNDNYHNPLRKACVGRMRMFSRGSHSVVLCIIITTQFEQSFHLVARAKSMGLKSDWQHHDHRTIPAEDNDRRLNWAGVVGMEGDYHTL